jgi:hypothetical protein
MMERHGERLAASAPEAFLASDQWSPRFENTFFTVKLESFELIQSPPEESDDTPKLVKGKGVFPAYYYKITVCCGHAKHIVLRRYSQFAWLLSQVPPDTRPDAPEIPPKTWICQPQDAGFAQNRLEQLREFLEEFLQRPGIATDSNVVAFLELERFVQ